MMEKRRGSARLRLRGRVNKVGCRISRQSFYIFRALPLCYALRHRNNTSEITRSVFAREKRRSKG
jgi:hypothetical protein